MRLRPFATRRRRWIFGLLTPAALGLLFMLDSTRFLDTLGARASGPRLERMRRSPNWKDGHFQNAVPTTVMVEGRSWSTAKDWLAKKDTRPPGPLPTVSLTREAYERPPADDLRVTWLGHSTVLMEIEGTRVLFDPVWAQRSSPSSVAGPKRFQPNPLPLEQLPELAAVAISHDHYDHLDAGAIRSLAARDPALPFFVPLGVGAHLEKWGVPAARIHELDWWEEATLAGGRVRLVEAPARHFSGRGLLDRNTTLWASWIVLGEKRRAYFGGDSGYSPTFAEIGGRFGPFDLTLLEIGAAHPNWGQIHLGPENALKAHADLRGSWLLPIHWGAFDLAVHPWYEPITTLVEQAPGLGARLIVPRIGAQALVGAPPAVERWWEEAQAGSRGAALPSPARQP